MMAYCQPEAALSLYAYSLRRRLYRRRFFFARAIQRRDLDAASAETVYLPRLFIWIPQAKKLLENDR